MVYHPRRKRNLLNSRPTQCEDNTIPKYRLFIRLWVLEKDKPLYKTHKNKL